MAHGSCRGPGTESEEGREARLPAGSFTGLALSALAPLCASLQGPASGLGRLRCCWQRTPSLRSLGQHWAQT